MTGVILENDYKVATHWFYLPLAILWVYDAQWVKFGVSFLCEYVSVVVVETEMDAQGYS